MARGFAIGWVVTGLWLLPALTRADPPDRPGPRAAFEIGVNGVVPLRGFADRQLGAGIEAGFGLVFERAAVQCDIGLRHSVTDSDDTFAHMPIEVSAMYLLSSGNHAPFVGGGVGLYYVFEQVYVSRTVGTVLRSTSTDVIEDDTFGAGVFVRAGVLLEREATFSWLLSADYSTVFADFQERSLEHALRLNVGVLVGGR